MIKKWSSKLAFICCFISLISIAQAETVFSDVESGNSYFIPLQYLKDQNLISGYSDGSFKPNQDINRAEAITLLSKAIKFNSLSKAELPKSSISKAANTSCSFNDLKADTWYYSAICEATNNKVINGNPDGNFYPERTINKAEAIKMIILQAGLPLNTDGLSNFNDVSDSDWFSPYTKIAKEKTYYTSNRDGNLIPSQTLTRGQFAVVIYRVIKNSQEGTQFGKATYYHTALEGSGTSSGASYDPSKFTAAHRTLPFGTHLKVTNLNDGKSVEVTVNDRGPYVNGMVLDLSSSAFTQIAKLSTGIANIEYTVIP